MNKVQVMNTLEALIFTKVGKKRSALERIAKEGPNSSTADLKLVKFSAGALIGLYSARKARREDAK